MTTVTIESPFAGDVQRNKAYLQGAIRWTCQKGVSPYASHQMLTEALDDLDPEERSIGIRLGLEMSALTDESWFFIDYGMSGGMKAALSWCRKIGRTVRFFLFAPESTSCFIETCEPDEPPEVEVCPRCSSVQEKGSGPCLYCAERPIDPVSNVS